MHNFSPVFVNGRDLDDTWFQLLSNLFQYGRQYTIDEGSYAGQKRLTFDFVSGFINYPHTRPMSPQIPASCSLPPPTTDDEIEQYFANYLMDSELAENEDYRYATWIVGGWYKLPATIGIQYRFANERIATLGYLSDEDVLWIKVPDQLQWIINHMKNKGLGNNHGTITIGYPESNFAYDVPYSNEMGRRTSPCLRNIDIKVIDKKYLMVHIYFRSWDITAFPTNIGGLTLLNEYIAGELGIEPGPLSFSCKDLHAYDHTYEYLEIRLRK